MTGMQNIGTIMEMGNQTVTPSNKHDSFAFARPPTMGTSGIGATLGDEAELGKTR